MDKQTHNAWSIVSLITFFLCSGENTCKEGWFPLLAALWKARLARLLPVACVQKCHGNTGQWMQD